MAEADFLRSIARVEEMHWYQIRHDSRGATLQPVPYRRQAPLDTMQREGAPASRPGCYFSTGLKAAYCARRQQQVPADFCERKGQTLMPAG